LSKRLRLQPFSRLRLTRELSISLLWTSEGMATLPRLVDAPSMVDISISGQQLKFPTVDDALRPRFEELKTVLAGKALRACR